ncbi:MAG: hypothetical protein IIZ18_07190 [Ruminococcus sp.]|nr:hypothetical protein [Ruminococcus sp.]
MMKKLLILSAACLFLTGCSSSADSSSSVPENTRVSVTPIDQNIIGSWTNGMSGYRFHDDRKVSLLMDYSGVISFGDDFSLIAGDTTVPTENTSYDGTTFSAVMSSEGEITEMLTMTRTDESTADPNDISGQYYFRSGVLAQSIVQPMGIEPEQAIIIADIDTAADTFEVTLMDYCEFETNDGLLELFSPNFHYVDENADSISYSYTIDGDTLTMVYSGTDQTETYTRTEDKPIFIKDGKQQETTQETTE